MITEQKRRRSTKNGSGLPKRKSSVPWSAIAVSLIAAIALPTVVDILIARHHAGYLEGLHYFVTAIYAVTSAMVVWEACAAWKSVPKGEPAADRLDLPICTAVIAAYLPNEQDIILDTARHMLTRLDVPSDRLQVIVAYNTPHELPVEKELKELARKDDRLVVLRVEGSRSKAQNVNAALEFAKGEIVGVYDADHAPDPDCFRKAWRWLSNGYDVVQGRCLIRNYHQNWLTRTIAVEFDSIYGISHQGRSRLSGSGIFGGSNGYWRHEALREIGMSQEMLTEDIDCSVRAILTGKKLVHDRTIVSHELAPTQIQHWLIQRKRWAQGWLEVTLLHFKALMTTRHMTVRQKFLWFYLLGWRECYPILSLQFFSLFLTALVLGRHVHWFGNPFFIAAGILNLFCGAFVLLITYLRAPRPKGMRIDSWFLVYASTGLIYSTLKTAVTLVAQYSHLIHDSEWVTTPRSAPEAPAEPSHKPSVTLCMSQNEDRSYAPSGK